MKLDHEIGKKRSKKIQKAAPNCLMHSVRFLKPVGGGLGEI